MSQIEVALDAYVLPDDHLVFKCSPGKTYRFYVAVRDANTVFPDVRGLDALEGDPSTWTDKQLLDLIAYDRWQRELQSRARGNQPKGSQGISSTDRRTLTFIKRLYFEGKKGDLVVIPAEGYDKEVLVGELLTDAGQLRRVEAKDGEYVGTYIGRPVAWRGSVRKADVSLAMLKVLHTQTAVFVVSQSVAEEVYRIAYRNFVFRERYVAEFAIGKQKFTAEDSAVVSMWLNGFDAVRHVLETRPGVTIDPTKSFYDLGLERIPDDEAAELRININSPGEIFVRSRTPFALALMALLALGGCDGPSIVNDTVTVKLKTVGAATVGCQHHIETTVNAMAGALGEKRIEQACDLGERAVKDAKVSTHARLINAPKKRI